MFLPLRMVAHIREQPKMTCQILDGLFLFTALRDYGFYFSCISGLVIQQIVPSSSTAEPLHYNSFPECLVLFSSLQLSFVFCVFDKHILLSSGLFVTSDSWTWGPETMWGWMRKWGDGLEVRNVIFITVGSVTFLSVPNTLC